ncbi:response regulator transcription factor [Enterococcus sp. LJL99]
MNLVILDINLPGKDGISIMQELRKTSTVPILILSAKDTEFDKIIGLEHGADDYLTKPFSVYELLARVKSILRRNTDYLDKQEIKPAEREQRVFDFLLLPDEYEIEKNDTKIQLTNKEFHLLKLFVDNPNKLFNKYQLYQEIWDDEFLNDENVLNVTIRRLRKKNRSRSFESEVRNHRIGNRI